MYASLPKIHTTFFIVSLLNRVQASTLTNSCSGSKDASLENASVASPTRDRLKLTPIEDPEQDSDLGDAQKTVTPTDHDSKNESTDSIASVESDEWLEKVYKPQFLDDAFKDQIRQRNEKISAQPFHRDSLGTKEWFKLSKLKSKDQDFYETVARIRDESVKTYAERNKDDQERLSESLAVENQAFVSKTSTEVVSLTKRGNAVFRSKIIPIRNGTNAVSRPIIPERDALMKQRTHSIVIPKESESETGREIEVDESSEKVIQESLCEENHAGEIDTDDNALHDPANAEDEAVFDEKTTTLPNPNAQIAQPIPGKSHHSVKMKNGEQHSGAIVPNPKATKVKTKKRVFKSKKKLQSKTKAKTSKRKPKKKKILSGTSKYAGKYVIFKDKFKPRRYIVGRVHETMRPWKGMHMLCLFQYGKKYYRVQNLPTKLVPGEVDDTYNRSDVRIKSYDKGAKEPWKTHKGSYDWQWHDLTLYLENKDDWDLVVKKTLRRVRLRDSEIHKVFRKKRNALIALKRLNWKACDKHKDGLAAIDATKYTKEQFVSVPIPPARYKWKIRKPKKQRRWGINI